MPVDVLARRLPPPRDLLGRMTAVVDTATFTSEQLEAIERRQGDLLLDAGAGSGKTSVLVERFARAVLEDEVDPAAILAITFTEKAAAELRDRIRARLRELGADEGARATEGAWISTIHGFCARLLRIHALAAGLDPEFTVLDEGEARRLADAAFEHALERAAGEHPELVAAHGPGPLRGAILGVHAQLRARGMARPTLPPVPLTATPDPEPLRAAARAVAAELGAVASPSVRVVEALARLERCEAVLGVAAPWPGELDVLSLPGGNGAALTTDACAAYREALGEFRAACAAHHAVATRDALDALLATFAARNAELKRARSAVDFDDLELLARQLLVDDPAIRASIRERFAYVMVDEMQDTNAVQLELIDLVGDGNRFMVGDAQQSIYGFRGADVELFEGRGRELESDPAHPARLSLRTSFRARPELVAVINVAAERLLGERFRPLRPGREAAGDASAGGGGLPDPPVEVLVVDKGAEWAFDDGLAAPWRLAEARLLAGRVRGLLQAGHFRPADVVVLTRATTDLRAYERALEDAGVPTYVIGGRGYWEHPQVVQVLAHLRALANPLDEEALYATLFSPLCALSLDGLVLYAAGAQDELGGDDARRLTAFEAWFAGERDAAAWAGPEELIDRALAHGYERAVAALPGGRRRLANVRKLMRLAREHESDGGDLHSFVALARAGGNGGPPARESEAPVEGESLDAVRLMTIHRAKGLEFPVVCVADLGRGVRPRVDLIRVGRDGRRLGLRLGAPGTGPRVPALDYDALGAEQLATDEAEERRLYYVAMTRAQEKLILTGAAHLEAWAKGRKGTPADWLIPALIPEIATAAPESHTTDLGVRLTLAAPTDDSESPPDGIRADLTPSQPGAPVRDDSESCCDGIRGDVTPSRAWVVASLSYSGIAAYSRCGYRFYAERVLGLPQSEVRGSTGARERGTVVHAALERLDLRSPRPEPTGDEAADTMIAGFVASPLRARLADARRIATEQRFAFPLPGAPAVLVTGVFDVLATERSGTALVVDYKTGGADPSYDTQRLIYALAALRTGAPRVVVIYVYLERPDEPAATSYTPADAPELEAALAALAAPILAREFPFAEIPHRELCDGCPAQGGLCRWPLELTARESPDRLF